MTIPDAARKPRGENLPEPSSRPLPVTVDEHVALSMDLTAPDTETAEDLARAVAGRMVGGPGIVAVIASGLTGTISGSAVANVVAGNVATAEGALAQLPFAVLDLEPGAGYTPLAARVQVVQLRDAGRSHTHQRARRSVVVGAAGWGVAAATPSAAPPSTVIP